jgi:tetratricopeptide (TPR) repeat protein
MYIARSARMSASNTPRGDGSSSACLDADTAASYAEHRLSPDEMRRVEGHIDGCASCRELISAMALVLWSQSSQPGDDDAAPAVGGVLPRGTRIGPFEIERPIDAGGMGLVYSARDARLARQVALKCVRERRGRSDQLLREARTMAQLSHPNVVAVYDVIDAHGQIFLAMELVVGRSVRQWLDAAQRGWKAVVDVFLAAGAGLAAAHAASIVHGDVKPANILFGDDGRIRVTDFGLSRSPDDETEQAAGPRGTPAYMAPEQRDGAPCDALGDQYAFCASLHEAIFGALPGRPPARQPRLPRALRRILGRGLALDPGSRYHSMDLLLRDLRATRSSTRRWTAAAAAVTIAIAAFAYGAGGQRVQAAMCEASAPQLTSPWHDEARAMVRRSFENTRLSYAPETLQRVAARLDGWAVSFEAARRQACEPGWLQRETPVERFSAELSCLEDRAREARELVNQLRNADETIVLNAIAATERLTPVAQCSSTPAQRVVPPDTQAVQQLRDRLARARSLVDSGKFRDALPIARDIVAAAEDLGVPSLHGAALVSIGAIQARMSDYEVAAGNLTQGIRLADATQDDWLRAHGWVNLIQNEYWRGEHDRVLFMKAAALGAAERVSDLWLESELQLMVGGSLSQRGRISEAQPLFEEAVRVRRQLYGDRDRRVANALSALGNAYAMQGNLDAGIAAHRQAVDTAVAAVGAAHPNVGICHRNLGNDYLYGLQTEAAIVELEKSAAILEAAHGPQHRDVALSLIDLGLALLEAGQYERAIATFERAGELWRSLGAKHPAYAEVLFGKYLALEALGRPTAVADLEAAVTLGQQLPPFMRARIQLALGRASSGARAAELVAAAVEGFATSSLPLVQRELAQAREWQRAHGVAP